MGVDIFEKHKEWMESLKEGDQVAISCGSYGFRNYRIATVKKVTPTGIVKTEHEVFNNDGFERGKADSWTPRNKIVPYDNKVKEFVERKELLYYIGKSNYEKIEKLPVEKLRKIKEILEEF